MTEMLSDMGDDLLQIEHLEAPGGADLLLGVKGEVDVHTAPQLERALQTALDEGSRHLVLDFSGVTFIDSSGLRSLIALQQEATGRGGDLRLVQASRPVLRLLEVTGLLEYFALDA